MPKKTILATVGAFFGGGALEKMGGFCFMPLILDLSFADL
jgi:hypothetical protein